MLFKKQDFRKTNLINFFFGCYQKRKGLTEISCILVRLFVSNSVKHSVLLVSAHTIFCSKDAGQGFKEPLLFKLISSKHCFCIINACTIWGAKKLAIATYIKMFFIINGLQKSLVHFLNNRLQHQLLKQRLRYLMPIILNTLMLAYRQVNVQVVVSYS